MTLLKDRMEKAGFDRLRFDATAFCKNFFNSGGTLDLWIEIGQSVAAKMGKSGQSDRVQQDQSWLADLSHPTPGEGHFVCVPQDQRSYADARQPLPEGHGVPVHQDQTTHADGQPIAGEARDEVPHGHETFASTRDPIPSEGQNFGAQRGQALDADAGNQIASAEGQFTAAKQGHVLRAPRAREPSEADIEALKEAGDFTYFQMIKLRAKAWSTYRYKDLKNVRSLNNKENFIINDVIDWGRMNRIKEDSLISLTMPVSEMKKIQRRADNAIHTKAELTSKTAKKKSARHGR